MQIYLPRRDPLLVPPAECGSPSLSMPRSHIPSTMLKEDDDS
jgi:hypothetical protein